MNGRIYPPIGQRERFQFVTINIDATLYTFSRGCTVERGKFVLVRVPVDDDGLPDFDKIQDPAERRFAELNVTPDEWAAADAAERAANEPPAAGASDEQHPHLPGRNEKQKAVLGRGHQ